MTAAMITGRPQRISCQAVAIVRPVAAGGETERYLRALSLVGIIPTSQWTVRPFGPRELRTTRSLASQSWSPSTLPIADSSSRWAILSPRFGMTENSSFPYGFNDGPVWAGKGLTAVVSGGATLNHNGFSLALDPVAFVTQNASFALAPNGLSGDAYSDWLNPQTIDLPQRFGAKSYGRIDPGESHIRWDNRWIAAGATTEAEVWGPAVEHPIILGNNAGGFPRIFVGTASPIDLRFVKVHGRVLWGRLDQSSFGASRGDERRHFATAAVGSMSIPGAPGLELGATRFFHVQWPSDGIGGFPWLRVFEGILKSSLSTASDPNGGNSDNQLASFFLRWAPPKGGFEIFGEYGREDHNANLRDFAKEPDHDAAYLVGFQRAWANESKRAITVLRGELLNSRISHLQQALPEAPWYIHSRIPQGHTERGQVLGSAGAYGGGAATIAIDRYSPSGRTTVRWDRLMVGEWINANGLPEAARADVLHAIGVDRMRPVGPTEFTASATLAKEFNRHFTGDAYNLNLSVSVRLVRWP